MSNEDNNPYQPPEADLSTSESFADGIDNFNMSGIKKLPAMRGWDWIKGGFDIFKTNPGVWILITLIYFVIIIVLSFIPLLGQLGLNLINPVFIAGIMLASAAVYKNQSPTVGHLFSGFQIPQTGRLILTGLVYLALLIGVMMVVGVLMAIFMGATGGMETLLGSGQFSLTFVLLFLVMMLIFIPIVMMMYFAPALITLSDQPIFEAFKNSFSGCLKNVLPFLIYGLIGFVLAIVATIPLGLGWLVLLPVFFASMFVAYKDIFTDVPNL